LLAQSKHVRRGKEARRDYTKSRLICGWSVRKAAQRLGELGVQLEQGGAQLRKDSMKLSNGKAKPYQKGQGKAKNVPLNVQAPGRSPSSKERPDAQGRTANWRKRKIVHSRRAARQFRRVHKKKREG